MPRHRGKALLDRAVGAGAVALLGALKRLDRRRTANASAFLLRKLGPLSKEHRLGRANLRAAFPEKSDAEIESILAGVWDNLGRVAAEFAHLDDFRLAGPGVPAADTITFRANAAERYQSILRRGTPLIGFTAHLANWEINAVAVQQAGVKLAVLYRRPNIRAISDAVVKLRAGVMGELIPTSLDAPIRLVRRLQAGCHVGMLVDQHFTKGVDVTFFGRPCKANPLIAMLARQTGYPIHGLRVIRLPGGGFECELTDAIATPLDADGRVDIQATMQTITGIVEGWVREHPDQWLWLHRRWR